MHSGCLIVLEGYIIEPSLSDDKGVAGTVVPSHKFKFAGHKT